MLFLSMGSTRAVLEYAMNQEYIARILCEKKENPDNACQGQCHLKKEIREDARKQSQNHKLTEEFQFNCFVPESLFQQTCLCTETASCFKPFSHGEGIVLIREIFHPPLLG